MVATLRSARKRSGERVLRASHLPLNSSISAMSLTRSGPNAILGSFMAEAGLTPDSIPDNTQLHPKSGRVQKIVNPTETGTLTRTMKSTLQRTIDLEDDIRPVSEFRADAAGLLARARQTQRALVLTQRGRTAAVVLDVAAYQRLIDELELLRDLHTATQQLGDGQGIPQAKARKLALARLKE